MTNRLALSDDHFRAPPARPALHAFMLDRGISCRRFGKAIGRSHEYVRRLCLPFGDDDRKVPDAETAALIELETRGVVPAASFGVAVKPERVR